MDVCSLINYRTTGRIEYRKGIDWQDYTLGMMDLCARPGVKHYIKRDLQPFLPSGYDNPMRIAQHF
jgi:hypothetical protein